MRTNLVIASRETESRLWVALGIASGVAIIELLGGILSQSLALVSDSGHVLTDALALGVSILTIRLARMPHTPKRTYGYHRAEIFAALVNGTTLVVIALVVMYEAVLRLLEPPTVRASLVILFASAALLGNLFMARLFASGRRGSLNVRGVFLHAVSDILSSSGVILGGLVVILTGYNRVDSTVAFLIGLLILRNAFGLVRDSTDVLMEATPKHLHLDEISKTILAVHGVRGVHDLHVWTITSGLYALSGHLAVSSDSVEEGSRIIDEVSKQLKMSYGIDHVTLQLERESLEKIERPRLV